MGVFANVYERMIIDRINENCIVLEASDIEDTGHVEMRTSGKTHVTMHKDDHAKMKNMKHGDKVHVGGIVHSPDDKHPGKLHNVNATRDGDHIHLHDHKTNQHVATIHHTHAS